MNYFKNGLRNNLHVFGVCEQIFTAIGAFSKCFEEFQQPNCDTKIEGKQYFCNDFKFDKIVVK